MSSNHPDLWFSVLPRPLADGHKYDRGHCVVVGGDKLTGAARLAATAAARAGAGLVTILVPDGTGAIYRAAVPAHIMVEDMTHDRCSHLQSPKRTVLVLGPGYGRNDDDGVIAWLKARAAQSVVLDADGLNALAEKPVGMTLLRAGDVLTPHAGEYKRLFGDMPPEAAARAAKCIVVAKGAKTVITDGECRVVNDHASPYLASAGTGDVLAGLIAGLIAQKMPAFEAVCAAVWMHGEAGLRVGAGLVASDLPDVLPDVFKGLLASNPAR